jgi:hypothetical protein
MTEYILYCVQCYEHSPLLRYVNHEGFRDEEFISFPRTLEYEERLVKMRPYEYLQRIRLMLPTLLNEN